LPFLSTSELGDVDWNAWTNGFYLFPLAPLAALLPALAAAHLALTRLANLSVTDRVAGFDWSELRLLAGALGSLTMLAYLMRSIPEADTGVGVYLTLLGALGVLVGAVIERRQAAGTQASSITRHQPTQADWIVMVSGAALLIGSFLPFISADGETATAWEETVSPLPGVAVLLGLVLAVQSTLTAFTDVRVPSRILGIEWSKIRLALGAFAFLVMLSLLIGRYFPDFAGEAVSAEPDKGAGFWIMLLAALAMFAGAVMTDRGTARGAGKGERAASE
jgi:hypothetical protein